MRIHRGQAGFSLIELIIVIVLISAIALLGSRLITQPFEMSEDVSRRAELASAGDNALQLMIREVRSALPNSVIVSPDGNTLTFLRTTAGGLYRAEDDGTAPQDDVLDFSSADTSFEVLGPLANAPQAGDWLIIYNLAASGSMANAYSGDNRTEVTEDWSAPILRFAAKQFPYASPRQRFYIVDAQVSYACQNGNLVRTVTTTAGNASSGVAADGLVCAQSQFRYDDGAGSRNALVSALLTIEREGERVSLQAQAHVLNSP